MRTDFLLIMLSVMLSACACRRPEPAPNPGKRIHCKAQYQPDCGPYYTP
jgi:hypothetical protein